MKPSIGRLVHYTLGQQDAEAINARREHYTAFLTTLTVQPEPGQPGMNGHIAHVGNHVSEGDIFPAMVVRDSRGSVNLQVHLDGNDTYWATSRSEGDKPGTWAWPVITREPGDRPPRH